MEDQQPEIIEAVNAPRMQRRFLADFAESVFFHELRGIVQRSGKSLGELSRLVGLPRSVLGDLVAGRLDLPSRRAAEILLEACFASPYETERILRLWDVVYDGRRVLRRTAEGRLVDGPPLPRRTFDEKLVDARSGEVVLTPTRRRLRKDIEGYDLEPDPLAATTKAEFLACMRDFHVWAKEPSFREISRRSGRAVAASTLCEAMNPKRPPHLPSMKLVEAFITGCGGSQDYLDRWTTAWRKLRMRKLQGNVTELPAPRRTAS